MSSKKGKIKSHAVMVKDSLLELAEELVFAFSHKNYMNFAQYKEIEKRKRLKEARKYLRDLKRRKWVATKAIGDRIMARLTEQGWQQALRHKIRTETKICPDGVCIVIFDIPETERFTRDVLRGFLKEWGFEKLQHSVWMTKRDVVKPMMLLLQRRGLDKWIRVIRGTIVTTALSDPIRAHLARSEN